MIFGIHPMFLNKNETKISDIFRYDILFISMKLLQKQIYLAQHIIALLCLSVDKNSFRGCYYF